MLLGIISMALYLSHEWEVKLEQHVIWRQVTSCSSPHQQLSFSCYQSCCPRGKSWSSRIPEDYFTRPSPCPWILSHSKSLSLSSYSDSHSLSWYFRLKLLHNKHYTLWNNNINGVSHFDFLQQKVSQIRTFAPSKCQVILAKIYLHWSSKDLPFYLIF